jgi:hypothetical protein
MQLASCDERAVHSDSEAFLLGSADASRKFAQIAVHGACGKLWKNLRIVTVKLLAFRQIT